MIVQSDDYFYKRYVVDAEALDEILSPNRSKAFIICGAAEFGRMTFLQLLYRRVKVKCFVDKSRYWQKDKPFLLPVLSYEQLKEAYDGEYVLIASCKKNVCEQIQMQLQGTVDKSKIFFVPAKDASGLLRLPESFIHGTDSLPLRYQPPENPPITIVSIVYNTPEGYLRRAIESVLSQTFHNFEYLVIDHGSNDGTTASIIDEYAGRDARIRVVRTAVNHVNEWQAGREKNLMGSYKMLAENIRTEYVCMLDSDDYIDSGYLQEALEQMQQHGADTYFIGVLSYNEKSYADGNLWLSYGLPPADRVAQNAVEKIILYANAQTSIGGWAMMTTRQLLLEGYEECWGGGVPSDLKVGWRVMHSSVKSVYGKKVCLYYVNREGSVTDHNTKAVSLSRVMEKLENLLELCLVERLNVMKRILQECREDWKSILYRYTEYRLMELHLYLNELSRCVVSGSTAKEVSTRVHSLLEDSYISEVVESRKWHQEEFTRLLAHFDGMEE